MTPLEMRDGKETIMGVEKLWHNAFRNTCELQSDGCYDLLGAVFDAAGGGTISICHVRGEARAEWLPKLRMLAGPHGATMLRAYLLALGFRPVWDERVKENRWVKQNARSQA